MVRSRAHVRFVTGRSARLNRRIIRVPRKGEAIPQWWRHLHPINTGANNQASSPVHSILVRASPECISKIYYGVALGLHNEAPVRNLPIERLKQERDL